MKVENDTFALVQRMRAMVYSSKDFESLWFLYQAEGLPKNLSIEEFFASKASKLERCVKHGVDYPTFDKWYRKTHKKVFPVNITGKPEEDAEIQVEASMEKDQLISMIHFLVKREEEKLLADCSGMRGNLMQGVLTYMNKFWDQLFLYLKDGKYSIDNSFAERMLRPMTIERKNSLTFGSHAGVEVSVIYHTFIETCKMCGVSTLKYFKEFFNSASKREHFRIYSRIVEREQIRLLSKQLCREEPVMRICCR